MTNRRKRNFKVKFFEAMQELLELGFDLDKNSARDFIDCIIYLMEKKEKEVS